MNNQVLYIDLFKSWININLFPEDVKVKFFFYKEKPTKMFSSKLEIVSYNIISLLKLIVKYKETFGNVKTIYLRGLHFCFLFFWKFSSNSKYKIVIGNFYIHELSKKRWFNSFMKYLFKNKNYIIISQSSSEVDYFKSLGNNLVIHYVPFCMKRLDNKMLHINKTKSNYIFSGGYSNRDYSLLINVASILPHINFVIVTSNLNNIDSVPSNVILYKEISSIEFNNLLFNSFAVIIPLKESTGSSGQMVALTAMQMSKCVIYTNYPIVAQYFNHQSGISIEGKSIQDAIDALNKIWLNFELVDKIGKEALSSYNEKFSIEAYNREILNILLNIL